MIRVFYFLNHTSVFLRRIKYNTRMLELWLYVQRLQGENWNTRRNCCRRIWVSLSRWERIKRQRDCCVYCVQEKSIVTVSSLSCEKSPTIPRYIRAKSACLRRLVQTIPPLTCLLSICAVAVCRLSASILYATVCCF